MTREKEIELAMKDSVAETIYVSGWGMTPQATDLLECAFTKGAEWADRNPKFSKQEFIEKVRNWLEKHAYDDKYWTSDGEDLFLGNLIDELVKYLEE